MTTEVSTYEEEAKSIMEMARKSSPIDEILLKTAFYLKSVEDDDDVLIRASFVTNILSYLAGRYSKEIGGDK